MRLTASELTDCRRVAATWLKSPYFWSDDALAWAAAVSCCACAISLLCELIEFVVST